MCIRKDTSVGRFTKFILYFISKSAPCVMLEDVYGEEFP